MSIKYDPHVIRDARLRAGLTQQKLGELIGIAPARLAIKCVSRWEAGERKPDADYLLHLMDVLKLSPKDFEIK